MNSIVNHVVWLRIEYMQNSRDMRPPTRLVLGEQTYVELIKDPDFARTVVGHIENDRQKFMGLEVTLMQEYDPTYIAVE